MSGKLYIKSILISLSFLVCSSVYSQVTIGDSLALVDLYNTNNGIGWTVDSNWLSSSKPVGQWHGISVTSNRVSSISLQTNNVTGSLPLSFINLTGLEFLNFNGNTLTGSLSSLTALTNLVHLDLGNNGFSGSIPVSINNLSDLKVLILGNNSLTGSLPITITSLPDLEILDIENNAINGSIPTGINNLSKLEFLFLNGNNLSGIIPANFYQLSSLIQFNLAGNIISGSLDPDIQDLTNLLEMNLANNDLTGEVPSSINSITGLKNLYLQNNEFDNIPDLTSLSLDELNIAGNKFHFGHIEENFSAASNLFVYSPQDSFGRSIDTVAGPGFDITMAVSTPGVNNTYQWYKSSTLLIGENDPVLLLEDVDYPDAGQYICLVNNTLATALTLSSYSQDLTISIPDTVWPGDADGNYQANNMDILSLGVAWGSTGPARPAANQNWIGQAAFDWSDTLINGVNYKHIDCNGDGVIDHNDTLAINSNYSLSHGKTSKSSAGPNDPTLYIEFAADTFNAGDTLMAVVNLGTDSIPADSVYGAAFTITYDPTLVEVNSVDFSFEGGWLDTSGNNSITIVKDRYNDGRLDVAISRIDKKMESDLGKLGVACFVMIDDLSGKIEIIKPFELDIIKPRLIKLNEERIAVNTQGDVIQLRDIVSGIEEPEIKQIQISPNPANRFVQVNYTGYQNVEFNVISLLGKTVISKELTASKRIELDQIPSGMYLISIKDGNETVYSNKLIVK